MEEPTKGFEPPTHALRKHCSTPELRRREPAQYINRPAGARTSGDQAVALGFARSDFLSAATAHVVRRLAILTEDLAGGPIAATAERAFPVHASCWCIAAAA